MPHSMSLNPMHQFIFSLQRELQIPVRVGAQRWQTGLSHTLIPLRWVRLEFLRGDHGPPRFTALGP